MDGSLAVLLLIGGGVLGLLLIPLGLPGLWLIVLGILGYGWLTDFRTITTWFLILALGLALAAELLEAWIGYKFARRYGGSRRAGWGTPGLGRWRRRSCRGDGIPDDPSRPGVSHLCS